MRSYRLIAEIGRGGMANVYLAVARGPAGFNKLVVIKKTRKDLVTEGDAVAMFLDEARLAARMNHPNVVQTYEIGQDEGRYFIAMEYLDGQPYSRVLSRLKHQMPLALHLRVIADLLAGLHHAHELRDFDGTPLGVVHRDATPQNVFVTYEGSIKVVDFGIAKAMDSIAETRTGVVKGKVTYMSPEQVRGEKLDRRTDVFAAGVMLFEAIAGRRMWDDMPDVTIVHELMYDHIPRIASAVTNVPPELSRICDRALAAKRDARYSTALEMARDIEAWLAHTGQQASARDVGEFIAPAFEPERQRVRSVIEAQLRDVRWTGIQPRATSMELPTIDMGAGQSPISTPDLRTGGSVSGSVVAETQPVTSPSARLPVAMPPPGPISFAPTAGGAAVPVPAAPPAHSRSLVVPAVVAAVASIGVVLLGVKLLVQPAPAVEPTVTPVAATAPPPQETVPDAVKLTVRTKPSEARIYLDGVLLSTGPFEGKVLRSEAKRVVRVEADRYVPKQEEVTLTSDVVLSFDLQKDDRPEPRGAGKPGAASPGAAGARPGQKPKHDIDSDSPYKK
jgi:serine/threonine-protein kinase